MAPEFSSFMTASFKAVAVSPLDDLAKSILRSVIQYSPFRTFGNSVIASSAEKVVRKPNPYLSSELTEVDWVS